MFNGDCESFQKSILSASCRLQRMMLRLQRFSLEVKYKPGAQMYVADHLSRASLAVKKEMTDNFQVFALELETLTPFDSIKVAPEVHSTRPRLRDPEDHCSNRMAQEKIAMPSTSS